MARTPALNTAQRPRYTHETAMYRISKLANHVAPEGVAYTRIADGDYEKSKHKLQGVSISRLFFCSPARPAGR